MASSNAAGSRRAAALLLAAGGCLPAEQQQQRNSQRAMTPDKSRGAPGLASPTGTPRRTSEVQQQGQQPCLSPQAAGDPAVPKALQAYTHMFDAMLTARSLLKRRNEKVTYQSLAPVVERSTGRAFKLKHLQQLKYIWPDAFQWQYIRAPCLQDNTKLEYQLLLVFEGANGAAAIEDSGAGRVRDAAARSEFKRRLCEWQQQSAQQPERTDTQPDGSQDDVDAPSLGSLDGQAGQTELCADMQLIPCAALPTRENAPRVGGSPSMSRGLSSVGASNPLQSPASAAKGGSLGARVAASPVPGRPPMSPTLHRSRASHSFADRQGSLGGRVGSSILDVLQPGRGQAPAGTPIKNEAPSPVAATPASRKRKAKNSPQGDSPQEQLQAADSLAEAPGSISKPRRRLMMGSPDCKLSDSDADAVDGEVAVDLAAAHNTKLEAARGLSSPTRSSRKQLQLAGQISASMEPDLEQRAHTAIQSLKQIQKDSTNILGRVSAFAAASRDAAATAAPPPLTSPAATRQRSSLGASSSGMMSPAARPSSGAMVSPASATRPGGLLLSRFMSAEAMQEVRRNSEAAPRSAAAAAEAAQLHATSLLPVAMDLIRAIFGIKGPLVRPRDEVVELMRQKSSLHSGMSSEEARTCVALLTQRAPDYTQVETQAGIPMLRINRAANVKMVRDKLKEVASRARTQLMGTESSQPDSTGCTMLHSTGS